MTSGKKIFYYCCVESGYTIFIIIIPLVEKIFSSSECIEKTLSVVFLHVPDRLVPCLIHGKNFCEPGDFKDIQNLVAER
jgi:hypothetical protein